MAKVSLHDKYVSEDDRKRNRKNSTIMISVIIGVVLAYILGYCFYIQGEHGGYSLFEALDKVEKNIGSFAIFYPVSAQSIRGWLIGIAAGGFFCFVMMIDNERHGTTNMEKSAGSGGFMTVDQMKEYDKLYKEPDPPAIVDYEKNNPKGKPWKEIEPWYSANMINSMNFTRPMNSRALIGNNNVLLVGGAGTGKSRFEIKPNILQMNASYIITDPSGEIIASLGKVLSNNGYKIKIFNISDKEHSNTYNPIKYVKKEEDVNILIQCLIDNTTKGEGGGDNQFFVDAEKLLYSACIFYLVDFCRDESKKNFAGVMDLIISSNVDEKNADAKSPLDKLFDKLPKSSLASKYYRSFKQAAGKTLKSIIISCVTRLQPFLIPQVINLTKTDELELEKMGDERTALFIITPQADRTYSFLASILYSQLFMTLYAAAERKKALTGDERLSVPVRCMMDEFANIGTVPAFDEKLATMRKYNISATVVLQNLAQIEAMYEDKWKTIVGNCSTVIFLGSPEKENLEYFSEMLGKETIRVKSTSSGSGKGGGSISYSMTSREVMTPNELGGLPPDECIVFTQNLRAVRDKKYKYEKHPYYPQTGDADVSNNFSYINISAFNNTNSCKYESMLVAQSEIKKFKKRNIKQESAENVKVDITETPDEVLNNVKYTPNEEAQLVKNYENLYIVQLMDDENVIHTAKVENMPTKYIDKILKSICEKSGDNDNVIFVNVQSSDKLLLGCVKNENKSILDNNMYVGDKKQLEDGNWLFFVKKDEYSRFVDFINRDEAS